MSTLLGTPRSARTPRTPRRMAALALGLTALLAAPAVPAAAAGSAATPASHSVAAASAALAVVNPGNQVSLQYDAAHLQMSATGGTTPYTWSATNLPTGAVINPTTGLITGLLRGSGTRTVTVTARDAAGATAGTTFTWRVIRDACPRC
ncbi:Ig domain-containing protein [Streptomyces sp. NPDC051183]|uniref:Ig domain-containing protein n=1 Tax=unclassified Streptomyces TaxID=2593676 RepID=UPI0034308114